MSSPTTSLVAVSKLEVATAATAMLASVEEARSQAREESVRAVMCDAWMWHFMPRYPFVRRLTRAEAEAFIEDLPDSMSSRAWAYHDWRWKDNWKEELAKRLQTAISLSQDGSVWLNLEDASIVAEHIAS